MGQKLSAEKRRYLAESLFDEHGAAIFRFAFRLSGNRSHAEDITGDTILAALQAIPRLGEDRISRQYLFGITVNKWRRSRSVPLEPISDLVASASIDIEGMIDLEKAFRLLPRNLQEAFVLVKAEGLTAKEAAAILNIPQGTVQSRVHDAVHRMRGTLSTEPVLNPNLKEAKL